MLARLKETIFGAPRNIKDPRTYHTIALVALLAWVGLGADGLSSSAYGPEEAFRALGSHTYLAIFLALATTITIALISYSYSKIIEHFPYGGGGYVVATKLLGPRFGVVSGSALLIDYILTISVSVASGVEYIFSALPDDWAKYKMFVKLTVIVLLTLLNLRGVKESVTILAPIFGIFLLTHAILIFGGIISHFFAFPHVIQNVDEGLRKGMGTLGIAGMFGLFMRAYSMGSGTYTGIEAVSNGLQIMREPKVQTGKRTMLYMSVSLAVTASGILLLYLLYDVAPEEHKTLNAVLLERFAGSWNIAGIPIGMIYVTITLMASAALLFVAAQAGFIDGPRVMANMAIDSWFPHRFAQVSNRLTIQNGVLLMGAASAIILFYADGNVTTLVTMYSINVFVTFTLTQLGMCRFWVRDKQGQKGWKRSLTLHGATLVLCVLILAIMIFEKFSEGAWKTLILTGGLITLCFWIRKHYLEVHSGLKRLNEILDTLPEQGPVEVKALEPKAPTAVILVVDYGGMGIHELLSVPRLFPNHFKNYIFVSVGVIDSATMQGVDEVDRIYKETERSLQRYVELARRLGLPADYRLSVGTEAVEESEKLCKEIAKDFPRSMFFAGKLVFQEERWFQRILHNETAYQLQRKLQFAGLDAMVLPVRVIQPTNKAKS